MKYWKLPEDRKQAVEKYREGAKHRQQVLLAALKELEKAAGLEAAKYHQDGRCALIPKDSAAPVPEGFRLAKDKSIVPALRTKRGKQIKAAWDKHDVRPIQSQFLFVDALFGPDGLGCYMGPKGYKTDTIGGELVLVRANCSDKILEELGFTLCEA